MLTKGFSTKKPFGNASVAPKKASGGKEKSTSTTQSNKLENFKPDAPSESLSRREQLSKARAARGFKKQGSLTTQTNKALDSIGTSLGMS